MSKIILKEFLRKNLFLIIAIGLCSIPSIYSEDEVDGVIVNIEQGTLRGKQETGITGDIYYSFKGIPYAKPPIGTLRFKAPQPAESWTGIRDATVHSNICYQQWIDLAEPAENESEDCLYLNVYNSENPNNSTNKSKPVLFWIHGGGFTSGSGNSDSFGPDYLVQEDIILVTINYRLGIFGFLSSDDPTNEIPGNAGLKDMVMALKWTRDNIIHFGGDPNNITISGQSAGGAATHLLTLSPLATDLFKGAIIDSGAALAMWSIVLPEKNQLLEIAKSLNITYNNDSQVVEELYQLSGKGVLDAQKGVYNIGDGMLFAPTIEKSSNETAFISDRPLNIIRSGNYNQVPTLFGYTSREGMFYQRKGLNTLTKDLEDFIPYDWGITKGSTKSKEVTEKIANFYYKGGRPNEDNIDITLTLLSDTNFINSVHWSVKEQAKVSDEKIYFYRFSVDGRNNIPKKQRNITIAGACHADNNYYKFTSDNAPEIIPNTLEDLAIKRYVKLNANFVKYGDPTFGEKSDLISIKWDPVVSEDELTFLELGENLSVGVNPDIDRQNFWYELRQSIEN